MFMNIVSMVLPATTIFVLPAFSSPEKFISGQSKVKLNELYLGHK